MIKKEMRFSLSKGMETKEAESMILKQHLLEVNTKIDRLEERFILEEITKEQYQKFSAKFIEERTEITKQLDKCVIKVSNLEKTVENLVSYSSKLAPLWTSSDYEGKVTLQKLVFPEGILYFKKNDECRTIETHDVFDYIAHLKRALELKEIGIDEKNFNYANLVGPAGIEPATL